MAQDKDPSNQEHAVEKSANKASPAQIIVSTAVKQALERSSADITANAILLAIRHMRREVGAHAGYGAQRRLDDILHRSLTAVHMKPLQLDDTPMSDERLSAPTLERSSAVVILEDAVDTMLLMHGVAPSENIIDGAGGALIGNLVRLTHHLPDWDEIIDAVDEPEAVIAALALTEKPAARIH